LVPDLTESAILPVGQRDYDFRKYNEEKTTVIDPRLRLPAPPVDMVVTDHDASVAHWVFLSASVLLLIPLLYALRDWKHSKSPVSLLILLGGAITNLLEPMVDVLGACWHPIINQNRLFEIMGHPMPVWLLPTYIAYFGVLTLAMYVSFRKGVSSHTMWLWFVVPVIADIFLEEGLFVASGGHLYAYYGNQPLRLHLFPIWWAPVNAIGVYAAALALALSMPHLRGWQMLLIPFFTPLIYAAAGSLSGFPSFVAINSEFSNLATQLSGVVSFALASGMAYVGIQLFASDSRRQIRDVLKP